MLRTSIIACAMSLAATTATTFVVEGGSIRMFSELTTNNSKMMKTQIEPFGDTVEISEEIRKEDWNIYRMVANWRRFQHFINDAKTIKCADNDDQHRDTGLLGLQIDVRLSNDRAVLQ